MKKLLSIVVALAMLFCLAIPVFATELTTSVPYEHSVTVTYNEGGYVLVNGRVCPNGAQFNINRFGEIDLSVILENGYHLESVTVNGEDVTEYYADGNLRIADITNDVNVNFTFAKCADDPNDKCGKVNMEGKVYLGDKLLPNAEMSFDFGSATAKTNSDGKYAVEDISEGRHIVTISKDGEPLAHITFVIEFADVDEPTVTTAVDGTQVVQVPYGEEKIYLDFYIIDRDGDGIPDQDPDVTDPNNPDIDPDGNPDTDGDGIPDVDDPDDDNDGIPDTEDPDDDNDGHHDDYDGGDEDEDDDGGFVKIGEPDKIVGGDIPNTLADLFQNPIAIYSTMVLSLFLFFIILFKRKKDDEEEEKTHCSK